MHTRNTIPRGGFAPPCRLPTGTGRFSKSPHPPLARGHPMLNRKTTASFLLATSLTLATSFILACDAVSGTVPFGKPGTSAPSTSDPDDFRRACDKKLEAIVEWERKQKRKLEDEWMDGKRGIWQSTAKVERVEEEARAMRNELQTNCFEKAPSRSGKLPDDGRGTVQCIGESGMDRIRAEYRSNKGRANRRYVGQKMCLRGTVAGFKESSNGSHVDVVIGDRRSFNAVRFSISDRRGSSRVLSKSVGDMVEAQCTVEQFWGPDIPTFSNCNWR